MAYTHNFNGQYIAKYGIDNSVISHSHSIRVVRTNKFTGSGRKWIILQAFNFYENFLDGRLWQLPEIFFRGSFPQYVI